MQVLASVQPLGRVTPLGGEQVTGVRNEPAPERCSQPAHVAER
jgi:hypothetical protein